LAASHHRLRPSKGVKFVDGPLPPQCDLVRRVRRLIE
jgi:hypothetical protein